MLTVNKILEKKGAEVFSVKPDQTVFEALKILAEKEIGAALVMDGNDIHGIFSERDYARKVILKGLFSKDVLVKDIMTKELITISPVTNIMDCLALMTRNKIRHLPVLENNKLAGMISIGDVVNLIIHSQKESIESLESYISGGSYA